MQRIYNLFKNSMITDIGDMIFIVYKKLLSLYKTILHFRSRGGLIHYHMSNSSFILNCSVHPKSFFPSTKLCN